MENGLLILLCFVLIFQLINSLPKTDDQTNLPNIVPFKTHNKSEPTVKYVTINFDEDRNTVRPIEDNWDQAVEYKEVKDILEKTTDKNEKENSTTKKYFEEFTVDGKITPFIKDNNRNVQDDKQINYSEKRDDPKNTKNNTGKNLNDEDFSLEVDEEVFDAEDFPKKPNSDLEIKQAFVPLSPNIKEEDLMKFLKNVQSTPFSYHRFQLDSPVKEFSGSGEKILEATETTTEGSKMETDQKNDEGILTEDPTRVSAEDTYAERGARKTNFRKIPYGGSLWHKMRSERVDSALESGTEGFSIRVRNNQESGIKIPRPDASRAKYQVIRVYKQKPKLFESSSKPLESNSNRIIESNFYKPWNQTAENKEKDLLQINILPEIPGQPLRLDAGAGEKDANHERDFSLTEPSLNDEITIRNMIRKKIAEKMGTKEQTKFTDKSSFNPIKRSDDANNINTWDENNIGETEIDLEDKITDIETQLEKLKKSPESFRSHKVDHVFGNIFKFVKKCNNESSGLNMFDCLKDRVLKSVESLMFKSNRSLPIISGLVYLENDLPADQKEAYLVAENRHLGYNRKILHAVNTLLNHLSFKVKLPTDLLATEGSDTGRGKKQDKYGHLMLFTTLLLMGTMIPIKMGMIATMAGKALMISIVSLTLAIIMGLKKATSHGSGHTTYEVINVPAAGGGHGESRVSTYLSRTLKATPSPPTTSTPRPTYFHSPYSTYATPYDNEHEGEISPETGHVVTPPSDDATSGGDEDKFYSLSRYSVDPPWRSSTGWIAKG